MLKVINFKTLDALVEATVPANIRRQVCLTSGASASPLALWA